MELISKTEELFLEWLKENVKGKLICLDVGANKGFYSTALLDMLGEKIEMLYCFEPVKSNFDECLNKFMNKSNVKLFMNACSNKKKESKFYKIVSSNLEYEGLSSLNFRPVFNSLMKEEIIVNCIVLEDTLSLKPKDNVFTKIDVEGHELEVLEGMTSFLKNKQIAAIQFEYGNCILEQNKNLNDIISFLKPFINYSVYDFNLNKELIKIDDINIDKYINASWSNLYIIRD
jgi:FkbM family methyltransferase